MSSFGPPSNHIRSRDYSAIITHGLLTDNQIDRYILQGRYGEARRAELLAERAKKKTKRPQNTVKHALKLLGL